MGGSGCPPNPHGLTARTERSVAMSLIGGERNEHRYEKQSFGDRKEQAWRR